MAQRDTPPFRADQVGSLLRPLELLRAREDHRAGRIGDDELRAAADAAIRDAVRLTVEGNALTREQQADKLRLVVETAEEVWG